MEYASSFAKDLIKIMLRQTLLSLYDLTIVGYVRFQRMTSLKQQGIKLTN